MGVGAVNGVKSNSKELSIKSNVKESPINGKIKESTSTKEPTLNGILNGTLNGGAGVKDGSVKKGPHDIIIVNDDLERAYKLLERVALGEDLKEGEADDLPPLDDC